MSNKYSSEQEMILVHALVACSSYEEQRQILFDLSSKDGALPEYNHKMLGAKARHMHKQNPESINVFYAPEYKRKTGERPTTKAILCKELETLTSLNLDTLENCNRDVIVNLTDYITNLISERDDLIKEKGDK